MKNIQIVDGAENCVYDIFAVDDADFSVLFPDQTDIAFIDEIYARPSNDAGSLDAIFKRIWCRPIDKQIVCGINGTLFYEMEQKKIYYPTRKDAEAINPGGSKLR